MARRLDTSPQKHCPSQFVNTLLWCPKKSWCIAEDTKINAKKRNEKHHPSTTIEWPKWFDRFGMVRAAIPMCSLGRPRTNSVHWTPMKRITPLYSWEKSHARWQKGGCRSWLSSFERVSHMQGFGVNTCFFFHVFLANVISTCLESTEYINLCRIPKCSGATRTMHIWSHIPYYTILYHIISYYIKGKYIDIIMCMYGSWPPKQVNKR